ncbi:YnfA family protein [Leptolyngbya sp. 7M]|uniref:YnfA family protein n=1 Tax=Leptolyngbya sp. 7M TaxID=2812896 RepID=UPI001B8D01AD|nr:YnfA family protein [Leptolyngbya sp. 7M]QYO64032.1 YnfA family protein [Leptolyngbya sp. 7M]
MEIPRSVAYFLFAGICELGGAYLIWLWLRTGRSFFFGIAGVVVLAIYGMIHTLQPTNYGRIQAAYSGFFIVLALIWGWQVEKVTPDRIDIIGGFIALVGVCVIMYWPRA